MDGCRETDCGKPIRARGLCGAHYERLRRAGGTASNKARASCLVENCDELVVGNGYCDLHYRYVRRYGTPEKPARTLEGRFWKYVAKEEGGCWLWTGGGDPSGYGRLRAGDSKVGVHRLSYELHKGPIPEGMEIDHLCRVRSCVNPDHLEAVTKRENILRGEGNAARYARRDTCVRGHSFEPPNGYPNPQGGRGCRACNRIRAAESKARLAAQRAQGASSPSS